MEENIEKRVQTLNINQQDEELSTEDAHIPFYPSLQQVDEVSWQQRFLRDFGPETAAKRPFPLPWYRFYLRNLQVDPHRGIHFASKIKQIIFELLEDSMTSVQELVLSGDEATTKFQIERELNRMKNSATYEFSLAKQNSLMHYAVLTGNPNMITTLIELEKREYEEKRNTELRVPKRKLAKQGNKLAKYDFMISKGDLVTGFTPLHYALFTENVELMALIIRSGANVDKKDNYWGDIFDYARMLGMFPTRNLVSVAPYTPKSIDHIKVWNPDTNTIGHWPVKKFEEFFRVEFCPFTTCTNDYIEELLFSGLSIDPDMEFRKQYVPMIYESSGDENLIVAKVNDNVGYGVFAAKDFNSGDYVVRYGGRLTKTEKIKDKSYNMASGVEGVGLDALKYRNLGGLVNHSPKPNCECTCIFDRGAEQAVMLATTHIPKGSQILIDYSKNYWTKGALKTHKLEDISSDFTLKFE